MTRLQLSSPGKRIFTNYVDQIQRVSNNKQIRKRRSGNFKSSKKGGYPRPLTRHDRDTRVGHAVADFPERSLDMVKTQGLGMRLRIF